MPAVWAAAIAGIAIAFLLALPMSSMAAEPVVANVSILSASYTGSVNDRVAQLDATIQVSAAKAGQKIALFGEDVAVQSFSAKPGDYLALVNSFGVLEVAQSELSAAKNLGVGRGSPVVVRERR